MVENVVVYQTILHFVTMKHLLIVKTAMGFGGIERSLIEFLRDLDYSRYAVDLLLLYGPFDLCSEINPNVKLIDAEKLYPGIRRRFPYLLFYLLSMLSKLLFCSKLFAYFKKQKQQYGYRQLYKHHCRQHYDTVIAYQQEFACEYAAKYTSADKLIMMYHHGEVEKKEYHKPLFSKADILLTVGDEIAEKLAQAFPDMKNKISVIQNYESVENIRIKAKEYTPAFDRSKLNICTCGRIAYEKGFDIALETALLLKQRGINFHWYFVGDGYNEFVTEIRNGIIAKNLSDCITITGFQKNPYPYLSNCDMVVIPSRFEANPLIVFESMVLGKPIISTANNGAKSMLCHENTGYICGFTPNELADSVLMLYSSPNLTANITNSLKQMNYERHKKDFYVRWDDIL